MFPPDSPPTVDAERGAAAPERRAGGMFPPDSPPAVDAGGAASEPGHGIRSKARKTWPSEEHREAAVLLLRHGFAQSIKSLQRSGGEGGPKAFWLQRLPVVAAHSTMERATKAFRDFLATLRRRQELGTLKCLRFTWFSMFDETPTRNRVHTVRRGQKEEDRQIAKVMAARVCFSCVVSEAVSGAPEPAVSAGVHRDAPEQAVEGHGGAPEPAPEPAAPAGRFMTLYGEFPTQLLPMENQTAGVVLATMRQQTAVPLRAEVENIFRRGTA